MTLDDLAALEKEATKGEWSPEWHGPVCAESLDEESGFCALGPLHSEMDADDSWDSAMAQAEKDAAFIAAMRNHAAALIEVARNVALAERLTTDGDAHGGFNAYQDALSALARLEGVGKRTRSVSVVSYTPPPIDRTGQPCHCGKGVFKETSVQDDMHGVLHCSACRHEVRRWSDEG